MWNCYKGRRNVNSFNERMKNESHYLWYSEPNTRTIISNQKGCNEMIMYGMQMESS